MRSLSNIAHTLVVEPGVAPAAVVSAGRTDQAGWQIRAGSAGTLRPASEVTAKPETLFDLASLTKPVVACALARLVDRGLLQFDTPLGELLDEARGTRSAEIPVELFLAHRAGLDAHRALYKPLVTGNRVDRSAALHEAAEARRPACLGVPPDRHAGFPPLYSDLGFLLVGAAAARAMSKPLDEIVDEEIAGPLDLAIGSARWWAGRAPAAIAGAAPTEHVAWRGGLIVGRVHDENAWALAGDGTEGHAGLFGTAEAVARLGAAILDALDGRTDWLARRTALRLVRPRPGGTLRAGFDGKAETDSSAGSLMGRNAFGHLGFTGTSLWCDPDARVLVVLLSNRVCPTRAHVRIRQVRPEVHDALYEATSRFAAVPK